jgi:hypothetical protein
MMMLVMIILPYRYGDAYAAPPSELLALFVIWSGLMVNWR